VSEIKCPNCGKVFAVDESGYADLLKQVRDEEFKRQVDAQVAQVNEAARAREAMAAAEAQSKLTQALAEKDAEIMALASSKDTEISALKASREGEISSITASKDAELSALAAKKDGEISALKASLASEVATLSATKDSEIASLKTRLASQEEKATAERERALMQAQIDSAKQLRQAERERDELKARIERMNVEASNKELILRSEMEGQISILNEKIASRDRQISDITNMRRQLSTKMVGESLEQHCEAEFNRLRATAFQNAYFQKDNEVVEGTKGDYVYREFDEAGEEIVSIMFEMKNEADESVNKKRNEDHFKKLDKDRKAKNCEYAVLVSLLEQGNELYDAGIVDVSYQAGFEKMYVIRPQFFIPMITLIRNAAMTSVKYKRELAEVRQQNIDVTHFEEQLDSFREKFGKNCASASKNFENAIKGIDDAISKLQKIRDDLTRSDRQLGYAEDKLNSMTIRKLTFKNPTMKAAFDEVRAKKDAGELPHYTPEGWDSTYDDAEIIAVEDLSDEGDAEGTTKG
jgi:hypothetical protein